MGWRAWLTSAATAHWDRVQVRWERLISNLLRLMRTRRVWAAVGQHLRVIKDRGRDGDSGAGGEGDLERCQGRKVREAEAREARCQCEGGRVAAQGVG